MAVFARVLERLEACMFSVKEAGIPKHFGFLLPCREASVYIRVGRLFEKLFLRPKAARTRRRLSLIVSFRYARHFQSTVFFR